jgi:ABC-2 type transport system ATP-binding protein
MAALAYRPNLLLLDEPSSGLDPIVRRDILGAIVRTIAEEGRTVVLSSHLLGEVDRVADNVTMIKQGRVAFSESLDSIKESHLHLSLVLQAPSATPPRFPGAIGIEGGGTEWSVVFKGDFAYAQRSASALGATIADHKWANFDEIFVAYSRPITDPSLNLEVGP